ncbi:MAG: lactate utilization protein [Planctomycetota bacterium]
MAAPSEARDEIMGRVRAALARVPIGPALPWELGAEARSPAPPGPPLDLDGKIARFRAMLERAGGHLHFAGSPEETTNAVREIANAAGARRILHSEDHRVLLRAAALEGEFTWVPHDEERAELLTCELGLTAAQWGVAETGTIVLESAAEHHRLASLLPPVHIALLDAPGLLETLDELLAAVGSEDPDDMSRTITMITGPSRTADIELTLVVGVHGPRELHVILLRGAGNPLA